jgi:hypothetical protein
MSAEPLAIYSGPSHVVLPHENHSNMNPRITDVEHADSLKPDIISTVPSEIRLHIFKLFEHDKATKDNLRLVSRQFKIENPLFHFSPQASDIFCQVIHAYLDGKIMIKSLSLHRIKGVDEDGAYAMRHTMRRLKYLDKNDENKADLVRKSVADGLIEEWPLLESGRQELKRIFPEVLDKDSLDKLEKRELSFAKIHETDESPQALEMLAEDALSDNSLMTASEKLAIAEHRNSDFRIKENMITRAIAHGRPKFVLKHGSYEESFNGPSHYSPEVQSQAVELAKKLLVRNLIPSKENPKHVVENIILYTECYATPEIQRQAQVMNTMVG